MRTIGFAIAALTLTGCAGGLSKDECLYADWQAIGYEDGARGAPASAVSSHRTACAKKAGVTPDMTAYLTGRDEGLKEYCQLPKAFTIGSSGAHYYGVCTGAEGEAFLSAYQRGAQLYALESDLSQAENALAAAQARLVEINHQIDHMGIALVAPTTSTEERIHILADMKSLQEEKERVKRSFGPLRRDVEFAQDELADYRAFLAENGPYPGAATGVTAARY